jgi:medium-chain acyl-[acyl-carrier-protein] hydrolase
MSGGETPSVLVADHSWLTRWSAPERPRLELVCLGHLGGGAAQFRPWTEELPRDVGLTAVRLPGREALVAQPPITSFADLIAGLGHAVRRGLSATRYVLLGICWGATTMFELARSLARDASSQDPALLIVVSQAGPRVEAEADRLQLSHMPVADILRRLGGTPDELLRHPGLMTLVEPAVRADLQMAESYRYSQRAPLRCPITAIYARGDAHVSTPAIEGWRLETSDRLDSLEIEGNHLFDGPSASRSLAATVGSVLEQL